MNIRAKVKVVEVTLNEYSDLVKLEAVYSSDKNSENFTYSQSTPVLNLSMSVTNPTVRGVFKPGKSYLLDFTETH
jgi:hypothetical protein